MKLTNTLYVQNSIEWRAWLEQKHQSVKELWLIFYKTSTGIPTISYDDALDEALCFGWIDSIIQHIDEEKYARKFTPRTNINKWSEANKRRVIRLMRENRMTEAGLSKLPDLSDIDESQPVPRRKELFIPPEIEQAIRSNPQAWENYNRLPPSRRRNYLGWVLSAKRPETIDKRLKEVIDDLAQNKPLGQK
jgi:uncharacterized protein YdeI (YjbR/CyaY-like superfamily)